MGAPSDGLELEARELEDDQVVAPDTGQLLDRGAADVAADDPPPMSLLEDATDKRRGRGLPLRPGDPDDPGRAEAEEEPDLGEDRDLALPRPQDRRRARADPRHHEHEIRIGQRDVVARRTEREDHVVQDLGLARWLVDLRIEDQAHGGSWAKR